MTTEGAKTPAQVLADGFTWGYPLVVSERTLGRLAGLVGENQLFWGGQLAGPDVRIIVAPNRDTLYSIAVVDLSGGPLALTLPAVKDRYYTYQFLSPWTESFAYIGTRATHGDAGTWVLTPPGWTGDLPAGAHRIASPTTQVFLLGRFLVDDAADVANVTAISRQTTFEPLAGATSVPQIPPPVGTAQDVGQNGIAFWDELSAALVGNPPSTAAGQAQLAALEALGIGPGQTPSKDVTDPALRKLLEDVPGQGVAKLLATAGTRNEDANGWRIQTDVGTYGDDFTLRALVARVGWGANVPEEAVYPTSHEDADGQPYTGAHRYRMHFAKDEIPAVDAFWSLTVYGPDLFFVKNAFDRYTIGDRTKGLKYNADGSLDLLLQTDPPADTSNWLPVPPGPFNLLMRLYLPKPSVLAKGFTLPEVEPVG